MKEKIKYKSGKGPVCMKTGKVVRYDANGRVRRIDYYDGTGRRISYKIPGQAMVHLGKDKPQRITRQERYTKLKWKSQHVRD